MGIYLAKAEKARGLLSDPQFVQRWTKLYEKCPWGTVFQEPGYLQIWDRHFEDSCEIFFIYETDEKENLTGLFPLARCLETGNIFITGDYHAEYQTWLATPENGNRFPARALDLLAREFPGQRLSMMFLAPGTPLEWTKGKWARQIRLQSVPRPLVNLRNSDSPARSLKKRSNKTRIRQLKKQGELKFEELATAEEFARIFDEIENYSHLRVSGIHNVQIKSDPRRKAFHLDLMRETDIVYPTVLRVGKRIASAQVGFRNRDEMLLCLTSMSPFFAKQSPSKIHLLMLGRELGKTDYRNFDLSPGDGYKERFATELEEVYSLMIFFSRWEAARYNLRRQFIASGRKTLEKFHIKKTKVFRLADKLAHKLRRVKLHTIPLTVLKILGRKIYEHQECRMYSFDLKRLEGLDYQSEIQSDAVGDLLKYTPVESRQDTVSQFHQKVLSRFEEDGIHSYSLADEETLLHYGWLIERQKVSQISEVGQSFELPDNTAVLFDFYTHPKARGRGLYQKSIQRGLRDAAKIPGTEKVFIGVLADNIASRHVIEKLGFRYEGSLHRKTLCGLVRKWESRAKGLKTDEKDCVYEEVYGI